MFFGVFDRALQLGQVRVLAPESEAANFCVSCQFAGTYLAILSVNHFSSMTGDLEHLDISGHLKNPDLKISS